MAAQLGGKLIMAFSVPKLDELVRIAENRMSVEFYGSSGSLRVTVLKILARVMAGTVYPIVLFLNYIRKNFFVKTADVEWLLQRGADWSLPNKPVGYAHGYLTFEGTGGATIPEGTVVEYNGARYSTTSVGTVGGSGIECVSEKPGSEFNIDAGSKFTLSDGVEIAGLTSITTAEGLSGGVVFSVVVDGQNQEWGESVESYRERLLLRRRNPLSGSSETDYKDMALRFNFVTDCVVYPNWPTTNAVSIFVADWNSDNPQLNSGELQELREYVTNKSRRSICANVMVASPTVQNCSATFAISSTTDQVKTAVINALNDLLKTAWPGKTVTINELNEAVRSSVDVEHCSVYALVQNGQSVTELTFTKSGTASAISGTIGKFVKEDCSWELV